MKLRRFEESDNGALRTRFNLAYGLVLILFSVLIVRLWFLQILHGHEYRLRAEENRIRRVLIPPPRGNIIDREGRLLAGVRPCFNLSVIPEDVKDMEALLKEISRLSGIDEELLRQNLAAQRQRAPFRPVILARDLDRQTVARIEARRYKLPGIFIQVEPKRYYPHRNTAAHLIGYLGEISPKELRDPRFEKYRPGDRIGRTGIERAFEPWLHGVEGERRVEVDAHGRIIQVIKELPPRPGKTLVLSIDLDLQKVAQSVFKDRAGAAIVMDVKTGRLLALASSPSFDLEKISSGLSPQEWLALVNNPLRPLENKAIQGTYSPGSIFKIITAAAALEEGAVSPEARVFCPGYYRFGRRAFRCWKPGGHGWVNLEMAIVESCDVYFYHLGELLGADVMARYARAFGLGRKTGIKLFSEKTGLVPDTSWKKRRFGERWHEGESLIMAIGQGYTLVTPIQIVRMMAAVANGGHLYRPLYLQRVLDPEGREVARVSVEENGRLGLSQETLRRIKKALIGVVEEGTGEASKMKDILVAGKTGTAQVVRMGKKRVKTEDLPYEYRDHAWFAAYAPADAPEVAVVVLVEHGGHGGSVAAPLVKRILEAYFQKKKPLPSPRGVKIAYVR
ncbi:penicillin-binding protein 2 [Thermosulfuriphilus sp.]